MKNILLASNSDAIFDLDYTIVGKAKDKVKWAYITTAGDDVPSRDYLERTEARLKELAWDYEEMDITGKTGDEVYNMLKGKDAIFMQGGNTFYLLKQALACNFSKVLKRLLSEGKFYAGTSAGSYLLCPNIDMMDWTEDTKFNRHGVSDLTALGIVPLQVVCHMNRKEDIYDKIKKQADKSPYDVELLNDGQAILVEDDKVTLLET
ncbi:type 1 glutamine amidotransferase-like domain-containing protein [Candidatus Parcubacteria bacterium]|jgi:dipeptidase E|nr:type 1 glutamine amidotransferase-like domain-containing protein [Candidatus Parcubacteria bacterium]